MKSRVVKLNFSCAVFLTLTLGKANFSLTLRLLCPRDTPQLPLNRELGEPHSRFGSCTEESVFTLARNELQFIGRPACSPVTTGLLSYPTLRIRFGTGHPEARLVLTRRKSCLSCPKRPHGLWGPFSLSFKGYRALSPEVQRQWREFSVDIRKGWSSTSNLAVWPCTPPHFTPRSHRKELSNRLTSPL